MPSLIITTTLWFNLLVNTESHFAPAPSPLRSIRRHAAETHLEGHRQRLVAPPVGGQDRAEEVRAVGPDQLCRVVGDDLCHAAVFVRTQSWHRRRGVRLSGWGTHIVHLPWDRLEAIGRRTEPPSGAGIYGNSHHNTVDDQKGHQKLSGCSLSFSLSHTEGRNSELLRRCSPSLSASANGKWDRERMQSFRTLSTKNFSGRLQTTENILLRQEKQTLANPLMF